MTEPDQRPVAGSEEPDSFDAASLLRPLMREPVGSPHGGLDGLSIGRLLALVEQGRTPLVSYTGQPGTGALRARSVVDLHGGHVGQDVVLGFELRDPSRPIILGVLRGQSGWPLSEPPGQVSVDADGQRMVVVADRELVLRCGKASVSLRHDGRVEIRGETILTQAAGPNRMRGGSVELN
jgi:hypothetical protein